MTVGAGAEVPDDAATARRLIRGATRASFASLMPEDGAPYASLVLVATDHDGAPLLLLSELAQHTRNLRAAAAVSLLYESPGESVDPLAAARVTVLGTARPAGEPRLRARFLARHPSYADFADFHCWRVAVSRAHLIAGFGRIRWLQGDLLISDPAVLQPLVEAEAGIVAHMNEDHADALDAYARVLLGRSGTGWRMTGIDRDGVDLHCNGRHARLEFAVPVTNSAEARAELVRLARLARQV